MTKYSIVSLLIAIVFIISSFCILDIANILLVISIIFSILSVFLLFKKNYNFKIIIYLLFCFLFLFKGNIYEGSILFLLGSLFNNLYLMVFEDDKYFINKKLNICDILSIITLVVGFFLPVSFYYISLIYLILFNGFPFVFSFCENLMTDILNDNDIKIINFNKFIKLSKINNIIFTKTGVLTLGDYSINKVVTNKEKTFWKYLAYAEYTRNDRISKVINKNNEFKKVDLKKRINYVESPNGVSFKIGNKNILVGNSSYLEENYVIVIEEEIAGTVIYVCENSKVIGYLVLTDKMRISTRNVIKDLRKLGIMNFAVFSNDQQKLNTVVSRSLGIYTSYGDLISSDKDFWLYYYKQLYGDKYILISDNHTDFDAEVIINFNVNDINNRDIIILDNKINKCIYLFSEAIIFNKTMNLLLLLEIIGKLLLLFVGLLFISNIWLIVLCNFLWIFLEMIICSSELL